MTRVLAQGIFDILHPGHLHYLRESASFGDELFVVVGRESRVGEGRDLVLHENERVEMVGALEMVDDARLGSENDIFEVLDDVEPDVITIGYDQPYDVDEIKREQRKREYYGIEVVRISKYEPELPMLLSSSDIRAELRDRCQK
jgi:FAD synthetase